MTEPKISDVFQLTKRFGKQYFRDVLVNSGGRKIIRVDTKKAGDKKLIDLIEQAMNNFLASTEKSGTRYKGDRANDVGKKMETGIIGELKKTDLDPQQLGLSGYPDLYVTHRTKKTYLELKTSGQKEKPNVNYRLFYFTSGKKISCDAHHLLLQIQIEEEANKYWRVVSWQLRDLYSLKVSLKTEWNANNSDFEAAGLLVEG